MKSLTLAAAAVIAAWTVPAEAAVRYTLTTTSFSHPATLALTRPDFLPDFALVPNSDIDLCDFKTPGGDALNCSFVSFETSMGFDMLRVNNHDHFLPSTFQFAAGSFTTLGAHQNVNGFGRSATLTVSLVDSAVPEPAAWAMMIGGFALVGGAVRQRAPLAA